VGNDSAVDIDAVLDSGAALSLFSGDLGASIGLEILAGTLKRYQTTSGALINGYLHPVRLSHEGLGDFEIEIGFSIEPISRNLLGRDFFDRIQVGFREHHTSFFVTPSP
jgi:hypothetical protein